MLDPAAYADPDLYVPNPEDEERHALERSEADEKAYTNGAAHDAPALWDDKPVAPPMTEEEKEEFFIPRPGSLAEMLIVRGEPTDEERWACSNVWKPGSLTLVVGTQQSFKSWSMFDLMYHAAKGTNWLDRVLCDYDSIVYLSNEKSHAAIYERLWLVFGGDMRAADKVYIKHREDRIQFGNENWDGFVDWVQNEIPGKRVLVIFDTLTSLVPAGYDENNLKDVSRVLQHIRDLQQGDRMDIILVHHLNAIGTRPRGHSALDGEVDGFVRFTRRGVDTNDVLVQFEPKDGLPSNQTYVFDPQYGKFKRASARALHIENLVTIVRWWQERNSGEGMTIKDLRDHFTAYRYAQIEAEVEKAEEALLLKREDRRSRLTNRMANILTVMTDEERDHVLRLRRATEHIEAETSTRVSAELKARDLLERKAYRALDAEPKV